MNLTLSPQIRIVALVGLLAIVAFGASMTVLGKSHTSSLPPTGRHHGSVPRRDATPAVAAHPAAVTHAKRKAAVETTSPATAHKTVATHAHAPAGVLFHGNQVYADLPEPLQWQLAHHKIVVVSLYNPNADVDSISVAEAHAGAVDAGAGFLLVNVLDNNVAGILTALLPGGGLLPDPGVLVYRVPGTISVRIDGFADRDSVAQAAANAYAAAPATTTPTTNP